MVKIIHWKCQIAPCEMIIDRELFFQFFTSNNYHCHYHYSLEMMIMIYQYLAQDSRLASLMILVITFTFVLSWCSFSAKSIIKRMFFIWKHLQPDGYLNSCVRTQETRNNQQSSRARGRLAHSWVWIWRNNEADSHRTRRVFAQPQRAVRLGFRESGISLYVFIN